MEKLTAYIVKKSSTDKTFKSGDIIWLSGNGNLNNAMAGGWLERQEWDTPKTNDFEYELCNTHCLVTSGGKEFIRRTIGIMN